MGSPFLDILRYNFSGQLGSRLITFLINSYLVRHVSINLLGLLNVRMTLLYTTIGFLVREPFRKACLSSDLNTKEARKYALLSVPFSVFISVVFSSIWFLLKSPESEYDSEYSTLILVYGGSALLETLVEPCAIFALKTGHHGLFSFAQSVLTLLQRLIAFVLIVGTNVDHIKAFCIAQIIGSVAYTLIYLVRYWSMKYPKMEEDFEPKFKRHYLKLLLTVIFHSLLKQALTDGAGYVMVFTNVLSLKIQAVYDVIERLGSLATRLILAPLEESAFIYFSSHLNRGGIDSQGSQSSLKKVSETYFNLLRIVINLGIVVLVFGIPYSSIVVKLYGGDILVENQGHKMLDLYLVYLLVMAINGITECFAFASMGSNEILSHGGFLFFSFIVHLTLNLVLSNTIGAYGFIVANCINSALRIAFNIHYISKFMQSAMPSLTTVCPSFQLVLTLFLNLVIILVSSAIFGAPPGDFLHICAHVAIGGVLFLGVSVYLYQHEQLFSPILEKQD
ncbi:hypothetical protein FO519_000323 [Halicephalobus sp. NKZ332]|nr:hypothetical protein FO519_000323 [Halicephalobus sp. NKZ332]